VLTPIHALVIDDFLRDLREVADAIGRSGRTGEKRSNYSDVAFTDERRDP
jgi:hypothetical protein